MNPAADRSASELDEPTLLASPVWRFVQPGESSEPDADESYVRRCDEPPGLGEHASYLVGATYGFDEGLRLRGLVQVDVLDRVVEFTPCGVFAANKLVDPLGPDARLRLGRILQRPVSPACGWTLDVALKGESRLRSQTLSGSRWVEALRLLARLARLRRMR